MTERHLRLHNTLTRQLEPVETIEPGHLRFYACGPTVYSYAHIGNFRSFLTADLIVRTANAIGLKTTYVTNITDVGHLTEDDVADAAGEDKMVRALRSKEGERFANIYDLARYYTASLLDDWKALNLLEPDVRPRATEHVTQQIDAVQRLIDSGHAYETAKGVYFSVKSFPNYGKLSGNEAEEHLEQLVREVVVDEDKRDPRDFALWKRDHKHLMQWHSPFGIGFPGWHIECSVMAMEYLGMQIDLHAGGEDLIFPHHECEIAQSEALTGNRFARYWVHTRFLQVEGEKMSKSKGNYFTVRDIILPESKGGRGIDPLALRYALISGHYRKPFNFTLKNLRDCARVIQRYQSASEIVEAALAAGHEGEDRLGDKLQNVYDRTLDAMLDDLNTPEALAIALEGVKLIHGFKRLPVASAEAAQQWLEKTNALLGIVTDQGDEQEMATEGAEEFAAEVEQLLVDRASARRERNFTRADEIRDRLTEMGVEVMDTPEGTKWRRLVAP
jgi:cysteinyl-tRNA synthetase